MGSTACSAGCASANRLIGSKPLSNRHRRPNPARRKGPFIGHRPPAHRRLAVHPALGSRATRGGNLRDGTARLFTLVPMLDLMGILAARPKAPKLTAIVLAL